MSSPGAEMPVDPNVSDPQEAPDEEWLKLTEGMEDYERFRYIARHVLAAAIREARGYVTDERIFPEVEEQAAFQAHLEAIDEALEEDQELTPLERAFLCQAVAEAMEARDLQATCPWALFRSIGLPVAASHDLEDASG